MAGYRGLLSLYDIVNGVNICVLIVEKQTGNRGSKKLIFKE